MIDSTSNLVLIFTHGDALSSTAFFWSIGNDKDGFFSLKSSGLDKKVHDIGNMHTA